MVCLPLPMRLKYDLKEMLKYALSVTISTKFKSSIRYVQKERTSDNMLQLHSVSLYPMDSAHSDSLQCIANCGSG